MLASEFCFNHNPCALIMGSASGNVEPYGRWLIKVSQFQALWKKVYQDQESDEVIDCLGALGFPDLGMGAIRILGEVNSGYSIVPVHLNGDMSQYWIMATIVMMIELKLLELVGDYYQITIPTEEPAIEAVRAAALKVAETGDDEAVAYPERFITAMPRFEAEQRRAAVFDRLNYPSLAH
jgi:hypothetical protein